MPAAPDAALHLALELRNNVDGLIDRVRSTIGVPHCVGERSAVPASFQMSMTREKMRFFLGLGLMISLFFYSVLRTRPIAGYEYAILLSFTLAALVFDYLKVSQFLALARRHEKAGCSHELAIRNALTTTLKSPFLVKLLGTELLALYYTFFAKFENSGIANDDTRFSYAKSSNAHDVFLFVAFSQLPFLPLIHVFVEYRIGPGPAWAITLLTLWSVIWFAAQVEAVKFRPLELSNDRLKYRFGLLWTADIPLDKITMARSIAVSEVLTAGDLFLSPMGSAKNVMLEFEVPIRFSGPYMRKQYEKKAAISLDHPESFLRQLALRGVSTGQVNQRTDGDRSPQVRL